MAWNETLRLRCGCPVHTRYKPESGQGAIKAGCQYCILLWCLWRDANELKRNLASFVDVTAVKRQRIKAERGNL